MKQTRYKGEYVLWFHLQEIYRKGKNDGDRKIINYRGWREIGSCYLMAIEFLFRMIKSFGNGLTK